MLKVAWILMLIFIFIIVLFQHFYTKFNFTNHAFQNHNAGNYDYFSFASRLADFWDFRRNSNKSDYFGMKFSKSSNSSCPLAEFITNVDISFRSIPSLLLCDQFAQNSDILCRMYLSQIGLEGLEQKLCKLENTGQVPKIVYFVQFGELEFGFKNYVAFMAAHRHVKPIAMYLIGDQVPRGVYWEMIQKDVPGVRFVYRMSPIEVGGHTITKVEHKTDIVRLQTLIMNGGIYLDSDMIVLRDLGDLLGYDLTMGRLTDKDAFGNAFIVAKRSNSFLKEWYETYKSDYRPHIWGYNSMKIVTELYDQNTSRIVDLNQRLYRPYYYEADLLTSENKSYDWSTNYAIHVWRSNKKVPRKPEEIKTNNSTIGRIFRYIIYGNPEPIK